MLTQEQIDRRQHGIGASEIAAICGVHPYKSKLEVWLEKATKSRKPLVAPRADGPKEEVGSELEAGLRRVFERRMKKKLKPHEAITLAHRDHPFVLASPDDLLADEPAGLEIKVVGERMAHHWADDSIPDYVRLQAEQNMLVRDLPVWYVGALIGGTDFQVRVVERDAGLDESILAASIEFWEKYIIGDTPPPDENLEAKRAYLRARYPGSAKQKCKVLGGQEGATAAELARQLAYAKQQIKEWKQTAGEAEAALCELVGDAYGIEGAWGKFLWYLKRGNPAYKAIAEELAGGALKAELVDRHRSASGRVARLIINGQDIEE
jgi:putative phage-type endonuclease